MSAVDQAELQRIAQQVELNRQRMESIDQQMKRLEQIRLEQLQTIETLSAIPSKGAKGAMTVSYTHLTLPTILRV